MKDRRPRITRGARAHAKAVSTGRAWLVWLFVAALSVRLLHLWQISDAPYLSVLMGDSRSYDAWAREIAGGDWIGRDVFYQAPLYPYFLGAIFTVVGHSLTVVRICQAILGSTACVLVGHATSRLFSRRAGLIAGAILALYPPAIFFDGIIQKTALDGFVMSVVIWLLTDIIVKGVSTPAAMGLGVALGALSLSRENALVLVVVTLVWLATIRLKPEHAVATFLLGLALVLVPVVMRNYVVGGGFYLTTSQFGTNLYLGNNPKTDGTAGSLIGGRGSPEYERRDAIDLAERAAGHALTPGEVSAYWTGQVLTFVRSQPVAWLTLMARKVALFWNRAEAFDTESQESYAEWSWPLRFGQLIGHFGILVPLACLGIWVTWSDRSRLWIFHALIAAYAASVVLFFIYARYRYPVVPFLVMFAAAGLAQASVFLSQRNARELAGAAILGCGLLVFTNWPFFPADRMRAITEHNLGAALQSDGRIDEAIEHYQRAAAIRPDYAPAYSNMGAALAEKGDLIGAINAYRQALSLDPDFPDAHYNLGNAFLAQGNTDEAITHFSRALAQSPHAVDVRTNLGIALAEAGRYDEANQALNQALQIDPKSAIAHRALGQILDGTNRHSEAERHLREAVSLAPRDLESHVALARLLVAQNRLSEAVAEFQTALELAPDDADVHNDLGIALVSLGRTSEAIAEFERAIKLRPDFGEALRNLAQLRRAGARD